MKLIRLKFLMSTLIMLLRLLSLLLFNIFCILLVIVFYYILPNSIWIYFVRMWALGNIKIIGIQIIDDSRQNPYIEKNAMVIANHISWLDIPLLYTKHSLSFIGRSEMKKWPLISLLVKSGGTIFINRERKRDLVHINQVVSTQLLKGATIGLFPEGRTGNGLQLQSFKPSLLESTIIAKSTIIPLVIQYHTLDGNITTKTTYEGDTTLWQSIKSSLLLSGILVKITTLPRVNAGEFSNREELALFLHQQINNCLIGNNS